MSGSRSVSNVYYLPLPATTAFPPTASMIRRRRWRTLVADVLWRVRFIVAEIRHIATVPVPVMAAHEMALPGREADFVTPSPRPSGPPAPVIDFAAARLRRRPV